MHDMRHDCRQQPIREPFPLADLAPGQSAVVRAVCSSGSIRRRLLDLGLTVGTTVRCIGRSPAGDPSAYCIRGAVIALRREDSCHILVCHPTGKEGAWD